MGGIGKTIGQIASVAAPFIPGVGGVIAGVGGQLLGGSGSSGGSQQAGANTAYNTAAAAQEAQANYLAQNYSTLMNAYKTQSGFNADGSVNSSFDPYSLTGQSLVNKYAEDTSAQADNSVNQANYDMAGRGFSGPNSMTPALTAEIRRQQGQSEADYARNLGVQATNEQYNRMGQFLSMMKDPSGSLVGTGNALQSQANNSATADAGNIWSTALGGLHSILGGGSSGGSTTTAGGASGSFGPELDSVLNSGIGGVPASSQAPAGGWGTFGI